VRRLFFPSHFVLALTYYPPSGHGCYKTSDILLLTDDSKDPRSLPTRDNLIQAMRWLVRGAKKDDSLFFHCEQKFILSSSSLFHFFIFIYPPIALSEFPSDISCVAILGTCLGLVFNPCVCSSAACFKYASCCVPKWITDDIY